MTKARRQRLLEAKEWFPAQNFTEKSHIVKAYRKRFNVDKDCAMRELCMLKVLSPEKQKNYENVLKAKDKKKAEKRAAKNAADVTDYNPFQDDRFFFIAGYTSGGAPYGITWEEARINGIDEYE